MTLPKGYGPDAKKRHQTETHEQQEVKPEVPKDLRFEVRREKFTLSGNECYIDHLVWISPDGEEQELASTSLRTSNA
ncbi:MAG TPA: hypothetical protein VEH06_09145 [Candidatus Bathyarchaeia archaeon]|nr:hypothetical protein [Candidatus Bathyarchaeia archaeon]